jgi:hypothetical protein
VLSGVRRCWIFGSTDDLLRQLTTDWRPVPLGADDVHLRRARMRDL